MTANAGTPILTPPAPAYSLQSRGTQAGLFGLVATAVTFVLHGFGVADAVSTLAGVGAGAALAVAGVIDGAIRTHGFISRATAKSVEGALVSGMTQMASAPGLPPAVAADLTMGANVADQATALFSEPAPYDQGAAEPKAPSEPTGGEFSPFPAPLPGSADLVAALTEPAPGEPPPDAAPEPGTTPATAPDPALVAAVVKAVAAQLDARLMAGQSAQQ